MIDLAHKKCVPCEGGMPPLNEENIQMYQNMLTSGWQLVEDGSIKKTSNEAGAGKKLHQEFHFKDFKEAMAFVNKVANLAEEEGHHPDIYIYYNKVVLDLTTHAVGGLSENDFIMAKKIEMLEQ